MREKLLQWIRCPLCRAELELKNPCQGRDQTIASGSLSCLACRREYPIIEGVPWLMDPGTRGALAESVSNTAERYGFLWKRNPQGYGVECARHVERVSALLGGETFHGEIGMDAGSGMGDDTEYLAQRNPKTELLSLDISSGVSVTQKRLCLYPNVHVIRGSVLQLPLKDRFLDFVYSYGVLHHTPDPQKGFKELARTVKDDGRIILYLYEDHVGHRFKKWAIDMIRCIRRTTIRMPPAILYAFCWLMSPGIVLVFSLPARVLKRFQKTRAVANRIPFNFGRGPWSVTGDLYDRFSAPEEFRFSHQTVQQWYAQSGFHKIEVKRFTDIAGLVSMGSQK